VYTPKPGWGKFALKIIASNLVMAALLYWMSGDILQWLGWHAWHRALYLLLVIVLGALLYFAALWLLGFRKRDFMH
jgi:putative peptidoglycan lipid II flippase